MVNIRKMIYKLRIWDFDFGFILKDWCMNIYKKIECLKYFILGFFDLIGFLD